MTPANSKWLQQQNKRIEYVVISPYDITNKQAQIFNYTGYTQKNGAVSKIKKKFISHLTRAQPTPSAAATVQVSLALITSLQCVHPGSHDTHSHGNQIHPRLGVACPL